MRIEWSYQARSDLRALRAYIAKDSPVNARRFIDRIIAGVDRLADFPDMGRLVSEAGARHDLRELLVQDYRLVYRRTDTAVVVVTVIHGSRDITRIGKLSE